MSAKTSTWESDMSGNGQRAGAGHGDDNGARATSGAGTDAAAFPIGALAGAAVGGVGGALVGNETPAGSDVPPRDGGDPDDSERGDGAR